ncbi:hypothetical protein N7474_008677 [Penicillium riverlandense]|uniref:uncharacterized protein n=1 Tax=Penicillium riverlandense TaxID=1903569 RepID=UPI0025488B2D|nr:uncharacterized protein N7474_008677 [Penicillium riverlandense]KAJ5812376.1 hypothetical protein N7474_008677 [Penicillium riverlandense]
MKVLSILTTALLSLAVVATPIPDDTAAVREALIAERRAKQQTPTTAILTRDAEAESVGLLKRAELNCEIVNVVTTVDCHWWPTHADTFNGNPNWVVTSFGPSTKHDFNCYMNGQSVGGIT